MFRLRRWYNQNRKTIWKVTGIVVFLIIILQVLNYFAGRQNNIENNNLTTGNLAQKEYTDLSLSSDKSVLSNEKITSSQADSIETINTFFAYCNEGKVEKAYELLTDECKEEMYPELKYFKDNYYKTVFNGEKKNISLENWTGDIYKVEIGEDILSTGIYDKSNTRQEYIKIEEIDNNQYKLNINNYIGRTSLNKSSNSISNIELTVQSKDTFMDYEIYTFKIKNSTDRSILLDNLKDIDSMYLQDKNNLKYPAYTNEISLSELLIKSKETREFKIKYYNKYSSSRKIESIYFSKVITDYTSELALEDYYTFHNYQELKIDL